MNHTRKKTSMSQVLTDIKPYIKTKLFGMSGIYEQDIPIVCRILLSGYSNVALEQGLMNGRSDFRITVKGLFSSKERRFEVIVGKRRRQAHPYKKDDLDWIDRLEEIDAALDDF